MDGSAGPGGAAASVPRTPDGPEPDGLGAAVDRVVATALEEDVGPAGDVTTRATVPAGARGVGRVVARQAGTVAGTAAVTATFASVDARADTELRRADGDEVAAGDVIAEVAGPLAALLTGERTALNLLGHLSGVATRTRRFVDAVAGTGCRVRDTRKTTPGMRLLDKAAVRAGGGDNHRLDLSQGLLVKDNHVTAAGGIAAAARLALREADGRPVQVEVDRPEQIEVVLETGIQDVLLDNFSPAGLREAVRLVDGRARLEASGGITLETVAGVAATGVDRVAVGALTHSAPQLDVALELAEASSGGLGVGAGGV